MAQSKSFSSSAVSVWNSLHSVTSASDLKTFRTLLKTHLFTNRQIDWVIPRPASTNSCTIYIWCVINYANTYLLICTLYIISIIFKYLVWWCDSGPKLFVKPSQKSNRQIILNAVSQCCLAGAVNREVRDKVLDVSIPYFNTKLPIYVMHNIVNGLMFMVMPCRVGWLTVFCFVFHFEKLYMLAL